MTKIYGVGGYARTIIQVGAGDGKAYLKLEFSKGNPNPSDMSYRPATYITASDVEQQIIESSDLFKRGFIFIYRQYGTKKPAAAPAAQPRNITTADMKPAKPQQTAIPAEQPDETESPAEQPAAPAQEPQDDAEALAAVTSFAQAAQYLKSKGVAAGSLRSAANAAAAAQVLGIVFPNYNFKA